LLAVAQRERGGDAQDAVSTTACGQFFFNSALVYSQSKTGKRGRCTVSSAIHPTGDHVPHQKSRFYEGDAVIVCMARSNSFPWQKQQQFVATVIREAADSGDLWTVETEDGDLLTINPQSRDFLGFAAVRDEV
jgi:hypothetical protein